METWLPVIGFVGYEISSFGRVRSRKPKNGRGPLCASARVRKPYIDRDGYARVDFTNDRTRHYLKFIHRLVLEAFVGPCPEGMECRHLNGNPADNRLENLCWGTHADNEADKITHGTVCGRR